jgi:glycine C-acetyltransferase
VSRQTLLQYLATETERLRQAGLLRKEVELPGPQATVLRIGATRLVNFASCDYLGLANHAAVKRASAQAIETWGVGLASSRAAVGASRLHVELERTVAKLVGAEDALVSPSGYHANAGVFEALLGDRDYVFCDEMIRPGLADGIRLSRARAYAYRNCDMDHLEDRLKRSRVARFRVIATDGVFPVTGRVAPLADLHALAAKYHAVVAVDDSEGLGVLGPRGEGSHASAGLSEKIDLVTGSFGKALGGGAGGFVAGSSTLVGWLRQKARPHLASTSLAPASSAAALKSIELLAAEPALAGALEENKRVFRQAMEKDAGLLVDPTHPAMSVLVRNAILAQRLTDFLYQRGVFAIGYCHPVVPEGDARICLRVTAKHDAKDLENTAKAIGMGMKELGIPL